MSFGDVIRYAQAPGGLPIGIGGDSVTIWHCDYGADRLYELDISDFSVIRSATSPTSRPGGIGGDSTTIWHCDYGANRLYELDISDFSVIRSATSPTSCPGGIGGDSTTIWHCESNEDRLYELDISDFSVIRTEISPTGLLNPQGIGGDSKAIWYCDSDSSVWSFVYSLSVLDFSIEKSAQFFGYLHLRTVPSSIGGDSATIWVCDRYFDQIYELDAAITGIQVGDTVLLIPNYGDIYDRACIKGGDISSGDNVRLYPITGGAKVAIKEAWSANDNVIF
ncbi:MAG: hypothetical protein HF975_04460 [ANME-2 cluster archaeon]|nr:hypothetical protein [ANME-2 cluster archaeon]